MTARKDAADQKGKNILLGVTGSIAAYKACDLIRRLQDKQFEVTAVMTKEAEAFITPLSLASLTGRKVFQDLFEEGEAWKMTHVHAAQDADLVLIAPATANIIGKLACGLADDLLSCMVLASPAPVLLAPAMNDRMYANPFVQANIARLKEAGMTVVEPQEGKLACGTVGKGHLVDIEAIVEQAVVLLQ